jgi:hypothetical protein
MVQRQITVAVGQCYGAEKAVRPNDIPVFLVPGKERHSLLGMRPTAVPVRQVQHDGGNDKACVDELEAVAQILVEGQAFLSPTPRLPEAAQKTPGGCPLGEHASH